MVNDDDPWAGENGHWRPPWGGQSCCNLQLCQRSVWHPGNRKTPAFIHFSAEGSLATANLGPEMVNVEQCTEKIREDQINQSQIWILGYPVFKQNQGVGPRLFNSSQVLREWLGRKLCTLCLQPLQETAWNSIKEYQRPISMHVSVPCRSCSTVVTVVFNFKNPKDFRWQLRHLLARQELKTPSRAPAGVTSYG